MSLPGCEYCGKELGHSIVCVMNEVIKLRAENERSLRALREIKDIADDEADITNSGGPNAAMRIQTIASVILD